MLNLDLLVDFAVSSAEVANGLPIAMVQRQSIIPPACMPARGVLGKARSWTDDELEFLTRNLGYMEEMDIAAALGRSQLAVHLRWEKYMDLAAPSKHPDYITGNRIAKLIGCDAHKVCSWIDRGMLPGEILPGLRKIRRVRKTTLLRWLLSPKNWIWYDIERVRDLHIRRLLELKRERWGDEWWNTNQVAEYHRVDVQDVKRYIKLGRIQGVQAPNLSGRDNASWAHWFVLRSEATRPDLVFLRGSGSGHELAEWSERCDAFMLLARAVGIPIRNIDLLTGWSAKRVDYRLRILHRTGKIPEILHRQGLNIQYRPQDGALFADWREHRARFPYLAQVMDEFDQYLAGKISPYPNFFKPGQSDPRLLVVRGVLHSWLTWYAGDDASRDLAYRLTFASHARPEKLKAAWNELQRLTG